MAEPEQMYQCQTTNCGYIYDPDRGDRKDKGGDDGAVIVLADGARLGTYR